MVGQPVSLIYSAPASEWRYPPWQFKGLEQSGWTEKASSYDEYFAIITDQAIGPILEAVGNVDGRHVIDICCGTGHLSAALIAQGARVTAVDFAPSMIELANAQVRGPEFHVADAEALPFPANSFDAALCAFGLLHMPDPDRALAEAARVLRQGSTYVYTTWLPPQQGWDMFDIVVKAIQKHGTMDLELPPSPPQFRFAEETQAERALIEHGFQNVAFQKKIAKWTGTSGVQLLDMISKATVRTPMLLDAQSPSAREAIKTEIRNAADAMRVNGQITMRWPYMLASARRA